MLIERTVATHRMEESISGSEIENTKIGSVNEDLISGLPDEVLILILSRLPFRDAVRTSILSKKWTAHWVSALRNLDFDAYNVLGIDFANHKGSGLESLLRGSRDKFRSRIDRILNIHKSSVANTFKLHFFIYWESTSWVDELIFFAINKSVEKIDLNFSCPFPVMSVSEQYYKLYQFPFHLLSGKCSDLKYLSLGYCSIKPPLHIDGFNALVKLELRFVNIIGEELQNLISNCPHLEELTLVGCDLLAELVIAYPLPHLKYMEVNCQNLKEFQVDASNLISLYYWGPTVRFSFESMPYLKELKLNVGCNQHSVDLDFALVNILSHLPQLEKLAINVTGIITMTPQPMPQFANIKEFELYAFPLEIENLKWISRLLEVFPCLQKFHLCLMRLGPQDPDTRVGRSPPVCSSNCLEKIDVFPRMIKPNEADLLKHLEKYCSTVDSMLVAALRDKDGHVKNPSMPCSCMCSARKQMVFEQLQGRLRHIRR